MQQTELFPVPNPCVGICESNSKGYCIGCLRSRTERLRWKDFMPAEKMRVVELCGLRRDKLEAALKAKREKEALIASGVELPKESIVTKAKSVKAVSVPVDGISQDGSLDLF